VYKVGVLFLGLLLRVKCKLLQKCWIYSNWASLFGLKIHWTVGPAWRWISIRLRFHPHRLQFLLDSSPIIMEAFQKAWTKPCLLCRHLNSVCYQRHSFHYLIQIVFFSQFSWTRLSGWTLQTSSTPLGPFAPTWRMHTTFVTTAPFWRGRVACISTRTTPFPLHISSVNSCFSVAASPPPKESDPLGAYSSSGLVRDTGKTRDSRSGTGCLTLLQPSRYPLLEVNSSAGSGTSNDIWAGYLIHMCRGSRSRGEKKARWACIPPTVEYALPAGSS